LALALGKTLEELGQMSAAEYASWCEYAALEPFGSEAQDWYQAHLVSVLANIHRDAKRQSQPFELAEFVLFHRSTPHDAMPATEGLSYKDQELLEGFRNLARRSLPPRR